ncbi:uncharacterized protein LOC143033225 [Oratosquilla oratoria]|uniref:uncharacterized protein LOC143033225 n=1 Tax=Oratosquilla oratoria TaxID=337810 RepID=UPI003F7594AD
MENEFIPRVAPPRPAPTQQNVPKPVVPEVSLMFNSDDSLILQPAQFMRKQAMILGSSLKQEAANPSSHLKRTTLSPNSIVRKECIIPSSSIRKDTAIQSSSLRTEPVNPSLSRKETVIHSSLPSEIPHNKPSSVENGFGASRVIPSRVQTKSQHLPLARHTSNGIEQTNLDVDPVKIDLYSNNTGRQSPRDHTLPGNRHVTFDEDAVNNYQCKDIYLRTSVGRCDEVEIVDYINDNALPSTKPSPLLDTPSRNERAWEYQPLAFHNKSCNGNVAKMGMSYQNTNSQEYHTLRNGQVPRAKEWLLINAEREWSRNVESEQLRNAEVAQLSRHAETERLRNVEIDRLRSAEIERLRNAESKQIRNAKSEQVRYAGIERLRNAETEQLRNVEMERLRNLETEQRRNSPTSNRKPSEQIPTSTFDPYVYQLIEDQNQQIGRLQSAIEILLSKHNDKEKETLPSSAPNSVQKCSVSTQTEEADSPKPKACTVGVNTSVTWLERSRPIENQRSVKINNIEKDNEVYWQPDRSQEASPVLNPSPVSNTNPYSPPSVKPKFQDGFYEQMPRTTNKSNLVPDSEREEVSLTLGDVVVQTIHDDPPSPDPSIHVYMHEYQEDPPQSGQNRGANKGRCDSSDASPVLGESASTCERKTRSTHRGVTFYNNVLTNVHNILQNTQNSPEEDEEEEGYNKPYYVATAPPPDLQLQAIENQLKHFGISFIKPKKGKENPPAVDSVYFNGLPNILSIYNVNPSESSPITCVSQIGATTAKYLKESQLAAIAALSPENHHLTTKDLTRNKNTDLVIQGTHNPSNFSLATKKFMGKYGLNFD